MFEKCNPSQVEYHAMPAKALDGFITIRQEHQEKKWISSKRIYFDWMNSTNEVVLYESIPLIVWNMGRG